MEIKMLLLKQTIVKSYTIKLVEDDNRKDRFGVLEYHNDKLVHETWKEYQE
jgi:hypothetical protein